MGFVIGICTVRCTIFVMPPRQIEESFIRLYEKEFTPLFRHCSFRLFFRERAREITQEAFCRVWSELVEGRISAISEDFCIALPTT